MILKNILNVNKFHSCMKNNIKQNDREYLAIKKNYAR